LFLSQTLKLVHPLIHVERKLDKLEIAKVLP
jgi:hypothetical protein